MVIPNPEEEKNSWDVCGKHLITGTNYSPFGFDKNGHDRRGFDERRIHKITHEKWDEEDYDYRSFHKKTEINKYTGTKYNIFNVDQKGFDHEHKYVGIFNKKINANSSTEITHYGLDGLNFFGFDENGFDKDDIHKNGTKFGDHGRDKYGFNADKRDVNGRDTGGLDANGLDSNGFDAMGIHCITGTRFDKNEKDWKGNADNLLNDASLKIIFKINVYEILHEDAYCVFAKHLNFQNTVFCLKIFSNQFNSIFMLT